MRYAHVAPCLAGRAPLLGVYGLSFNSALTASCLFRAWRSRQPKTSVTYAVIVLTLWAGGGVLKPIQWVANASPEPLDVVIIQPNVPQQHKWDRDWYWPILNQLRDASTEHFGQDILVWPEAAIPGYYQRAEDFLDPLALRAQADETTLITGIPYLGDEPGVYFNSILALGHGGGVYHKRRLVPFGEYVPLQQWLRGLIAFFDLPMSAFSPGPDVQAPLRAGSYRVAPFICYEIVYPDMVARGARDADLLITISNDSWFGQSIGPLQHLQIAQMRALETGRYLIRGTNNGVSAIIDHRGQIVTRTEQFVEATLEGEVEVMLGLTPFGSFGSRPIILGCASALLLMVLMYLGFWRETE